MSTGEKSYREKQAYAKSLGINPFGKKEDELDAAIAEAEAKGVVPEETPVTPKADAPERKKTSAKEETKPATVDPAAVYAVLSEEINKKFAALQQQAQQGKKPETPDAVIDMQHKTDAAIIAQSEKVPVFIPGGYVGAPKHISVCVNGCLRVVPLGKQVMVPKPIAEALERSFELKKKNMERNAKLERQAIEAGI